MLIGKIVILAHNLGVKDFSNHKKICEGFNADFWIRTIFDKFYSNLTNSISKINVEYGCILGGDPAAP